MSPRAVSSSVIEQPPVVHADDEVGDAVRAMLDAGFVALPVVDADEKLVGIFGEREFIGAIFPGYLKELSYAGFVRRELDETLEKRAACRHEPVRKYANTEHVELDEDHSDVEIAETFLHHRVLMLPVIDRDRHVVGVITRTSFFRALAERFLAM
ncbi:MAG: hypothetical protein AVDCRST_MAG30-1139 [uncultured Solirubrobacteraceae bacterium]|uniref:CBS domain-containing protein n=1 Tax=uncultured Solirubrobacteraceae bacterium TaxID=1162706 RepID=A0A6J4S7K5_9ACTN|nr:MAG: hypothetical protein AVDCRST_MAG30-1139 [uncultured Solirubrobacteraceae bacterium]